MRDWTDIVQSWLLGIVAFAMACLLAASLPGCTYMKVPTEHGDAIYVTWFKSVKADQIHAAVSTTQPFALDTQNYESDESKALETLGKALDKIPNASK